MNIADPRMEKWSRKLLDFSARNRLLNIPASSRLVVELKDENVAKLEDSLSTSKSVRIASPLPEKELSKRLKDILRQSRTDIEETGSNTLHLAFGSLVWRDEAQGSKAKSYRAPILLFGVKLERKSIADGITMSKRDEDAALNPTLVEFLRSRFAINVPGIDPLPQDDSGVDVKAVLNAFSEIAKTKPGWTVEETVHLGCFSFAKFTMWKDMTERAAALKASPLVSHILDGKGDFDDGIKIFPEEELAKHIDYSKIFCPISADSSQLAAVVYSSLGKTFVLHGPPGSGKSQTIVNMIAHNLALGKRVLFVSEKKAALDVVKRRLDKIGLSPFLLELHSAKAEKANFYAQLREALEVASTFEPADWQRVCADLERMQRELETPCREMHQKRNNGLSAYASSVCLIAPGPKPCELATSCLEMDRDTLLDLREAVEKASSAYAALPEGAAQALAPVKSFTWTPAAEKEVAASLKRLAERPRLLRTIFAMCSKVFSWHRKMDVANAATCALDHIDSSRAVMKWREEISPVVAHFGENFANALCAAGPQDALKLFDRSIAAKTLDEIFAECPNLASFAGASHQDSAARLAKLVERSRELAKEMAFARLASRLPLPGVAAAKKDTSELGIVRRECSKKTRQLAPRQLLAASKTIIPAMKPCFLMSPLSVAQYLPPDLDSFDLVVFDEASQMSVWDSIGVIARAKQLVVVGDPKQMPPTSFFQKGESAEDDDESEDDDDVFVAEDQESILDECLVSGVPSAYLAWHYRSRHESLIAFSNQRYYDSRLKTFPAASRSDRLGVKFVHIPDGVFAPRSAKGGVKVNIPEATALVDYVVHEALRTDVPKRTIGIVTFSLAQRRLIEDMIEERRAKDRELETALPETGPGAYFVKNLENVQGDEADAILFSVGYAPDEHGKMTMNFGPLNLSGGERRLNVAITRSREQVVVFSSIRACDINDEGKAQGVADLKAFLAYAEKASHARGDAPQNANTANEDPFAATVASFLREQGYDVDLDVGEGGCKVDIAVKGKDGYTAAILCDSDAWANQPTVQDRELNSPGVLASLGWKVLRVWSLEWMLEREKAQSSLLNELKTA